MKRGFLLLSLFAIAQSVPSLAQDPAAADRLGSATFDWEKLVAKPNAAGTGEQRQVTDQPTATLEKLEIHVTTLKPQAASHPPHQHAREELIVIKEGTLEASINGQPKRGGPGSMFFYGSNDFHNVTNVGTAPATYLVLNFLTAATKDAPAAGATAAAVPGVMVSTAFDWEKLEAKPTPQGARRDIFNSQTTTLTKFECHATTLKSGEAPHPSHHHPDEEIIIVKEGLIEATIKGATTPGGPGTIFFCASNDEHGVKNAGDAPATYFIIRMASAATPAATVEK